ncbi:NAD(P)H-hydrate dehydratase [Coraliomargarita algicola]|uniref:ADP-dependent (S)-NAD(P)H-hydrate dehydratase n=1 Tax=Coraliomargarita algicola TaxID=3092156 RepID=A0ABZ0RPV5_9BACT|nr:NAD(P)H-hydrate dehydratase [Coraliomargarita sp. J2-16]WPJ94969.1 NAD(P)H-hydrate dehydratase [Coraliomargarita sp. J2-16]
MLTCREAKNFETALLIDESAEWTAMVRAGQGIARLLVEDYAEIRPVPEHLRVLALVGKGHNGGDALLACGQLLADYPRAKVDVILAAHADQLRPLTVRALEQVEGRVQIHSISEQSDVVKLTQMLMRVGGYEGFHICIDGLLGMSFKPPLREPVAALIAAVNAFEGIDLRASVDLPSGTGDEVWEGARTFDADFSYATGVVKQPLFAGIADCGRVRYVDLGFFETPQGKELVTEQVVLTDAVLDPVRRLRPAAVDKRSFGHLFIVGGSAFMPGALLMAVKAAVRSGVGLVTAFVPASVAGALSAQVPEAMWIPWPETFHGMLNPRAMSLLLNRIRYATAVLVGPGMGLGRSTELITQQIVKRVDLPILLDADSLCVRAMEVVQKRRVDYAPIVITPHMGEFMRIAKLPEPNNSLEAMLGFSQVYHVVTVLKGANTRISDGKTVMYSTQGGPVLSRGGSGDMLSGIIGGMLAQGNVAVPLAVARGVMLHGLAAQRLARAKGQVAVNTTQILDYLPEVLRG